MITNWCEIFVSKMLWKKMCNLLREIEWETFDLILEWHLFADLSQSKSSSNSSHFDGKTRHSMTFSETFCARFYRTQIKHEIR